MRNGAVKRQKGRKRFFFEKKNQKTFFRLLTRGDAAVAAAGFLLLVAGMLWLGAQAARPLAVGGPFALTDQDGRPVTDRDFRGRYLLVTFGYTHCRDVCPTNLNAITGALQRLGAAARFVQPLFITLDPQRDTPAVLKHYIASFAPSLRGLTGSAEALAKVAREYRVTSVAQPGADAAIDHSAVIYLMAPDGHYLAPLPSDGSGDELAARLAHYLS
jgi:protein SCO1/2